MGKFSDYVGSINEQTNILRENLTNATGVDCSKKSIGACADVVADYVPDLEKEEVYYDRPSWYPDIKTILNSAPEITVEGTTYYPAYIMLFNNFNSTTPFYKSDSSTSSAVNYNRGTRGNAVLCSDKCNNNINNASADNLEIGTEIIHTWDTSKDIEDPIGEDKYKVRWSIVYCIKEVNAQNPTVNGYQDCLELIIGPNMRYGNYAFYGNSGNRNNSIRYIEVLENANWEEISATSTSLSLQYMSRLKELIINCNMKTIDKGPGSNCGELQYIHLPDSVSKISNTFSIPTLKRIDLPSQCIYASTTAFMSSVKNLKKLHIPKNFTQIFAGLADCYNLESLIFSEGSNFSSAASSSFITNCVNLKTLILPADVTVLNIPSWFSYSYNLKYVKIPSSVTSLKIVSNTFGYTKYIELFNDFNISAVNFTGQIPKDLNWLCDLCIWLKDRTGDTANTMIIGSKNLQNAQNLWLTFNPDNKRDITWVDAGTEGAINIVDFITSELNWSLS